MLYNLFLRKLVVLWSIVLPMSASRMVLWKLWFTAGVIINCSLLNSGFAYVDWLTTVNYCLELFMFFAQFQSGFKIKIISNVL